MAFRSMGQSRHIYMHVLLLYMAFSMFMIERKHGDHDDGSWWWGFEKGEGNFWPKLMQGKMGKSLSIPSSLLSFLLQGQQWLKRTHNFECPPSSVTAFLFSSAFFAFFFSIITIANSSSSKKCLLDGTPNAYSLFFFQKQRKCMEFGSN